MLSMEKLNDSISLQNICYKTDSSYVVHVAIKITLLLVKWWVRYKGQNTYNYTHGISISNLNTFDINEKPYFSDKFIM